MPSQLESCIGFLEENADAKSAYFSFTTDGSGEHGVIKANKDGLRLYALELLRKSLEMEEEPHPKNVLFFDNHDWIVDDAGYNLIWGVEPTDATREEILEDDKTTIPPVSTNKGVASNLALSGWLPSLIILSGGLVIVTIAAFKWFH